METHVESFTEGLARLLKQDPPKRKGDRTRERMKLAAAGVLEQRGYHGMRVADITEAAESADGAFYIYFKDKKDITLAVLREFLAGMQESVQSGAGAGRSPFEAIQRTNLNWLRIVRANAGLMRCVFQMGDEDPEFGRLVHSYNRKWHERIAKSVLRKYPDGALDFPAVLFAAWSLGAMMDELMRRIVIYPDPELLEFLASAVPDDEALAATLSVIWLRVLYPAEAPPDGLAGLAAAVARIGQPPPDSP